MKMGLGESTTHRGTGKGVDAPRCLVPYSFTFWSFQETSGVSFVPKKIVKNFSSFGELSFLHENNTTVVLLKTASVRVSSMQIIEKPYKIIVNIA